MNTMRLRDTFLTAFSGVTVNTSRALLTMLGIVIGVGAVVLMSAIGKSMEGVILGQISSLGAKSMVIFPGATEGMPTSAGFDSLTFEDIRELEQLSTVTSIAPVIFVPGRTVFLSEEANPQVLGVVPQFFENQNIEIDFGRFIDQRDVDGAQSVAVLGSEMQEKLFGQVDPIGKRIKVGNNSFMVVGMAKALGAQFFQSADDRIYIPYSTARAITGQKYVNFVTMQATGMFDRAVDDVKYTLRRRHGIDNPDDEQKKDDFIVHTSEEASEILGSVSIGLTMFITTIAAVSLLVGGIGIMNIMLVSVTERTQEIGLRKALGARRRDILWQFLIEAVVLTFLGGVVGVIGGIIFAFFGAKIVAYYLSSYLFAVSPGSIVAAFVMAAATGLVFGITPARRAADLNPIEALRYE